MSPFAHGLSASLVAVTFAQIAPEETNYIAAAVIAAGGLQSPQRSLI